MYSKSPSNSTSHAPSLWGGGSVDRSSAFRQNGAYRRLKRQSHRLSPFRVYQIEAYRRQIDKQNFSQEISEHKKHLQQDQAKYLSNKLRGGVHGEEKWVGAIVLTSDTFKK